MKLTKIGIIASGIGMTIATIPLAFSMLSQELLLLYIAFKVWLFGATAAIFLYLSRRSDRKNS